MARQRRKVSVFALCALAASGCTTLLPFHFTETAEVLKRGETSLQVAGGAGGTSGFAYGGGGARFRAGFGGSVELGVEALGFGGTPPCDTGNASCVQGGPDQVYSGKLSLKVGIVPSFAFLGGTGGLYDVRKGQFAVGGDFGFVVSSATADQPNGIYSGLRFSVAVAPTGGERQGTLVWPVGASFGWKDSRWRFFLEAGLVVVFFDDRPGGDSLGSYAGYGSVGITYRFGHGPLLAQ